ncbi:hypothetical protein [Nannocystis exedens]|uniref:hypothetical protein n=1 Tax=Nannocystis exedens TaxID=54 RepID=UPI0011602520|nr:hypothetical protein [Nannocystis exedens]
MSSASSAARALELTRELLASGPFADAEERVAWAEIEARDVDRVKRAGVTCAAATADTTPVGLPPEPTIHVPMSEGDDPHGGSRKLEAANASMNKFFREGIVETFCDGACDPE